MRRDHWEKQLNTAHRFRLPVTYSWLQKYADDRWEALSKERKKKKLCREFVVVVVVVQGAIS